MIPILYESNETAFTSNGLGRLREMIEAKVVEERNGVYELDFSYPVTADDFNDIQIGRIVGATHDDTNDIQPFDIVSYTKPIDGIVTFHCVHISYRQSYLTVTGSNINSLSAAFNLLRNATPTNPFSYQTDKASTGYMGAADGVPKTVRQMLGGVEGSILDAYGGEYEWDRWTVILHTARGTDRDFSIRYGVNMLDYNEELDNQGTYSACVPYWTDGTTTVVGDKQTYGETITGRGECVPLDVSERFETQPTKAQVNAMGLSVMRSNNSTIPSQNIHVEFVRLQDMGYEGLDNLLTCKLCDTVNVVFPFYGTTGRFKIVRTVWDVLADRFESMELGDLSVTLSEALGINDIQKDSKSTVEQILDKLDVKTPTISISTTTGELVSSFVRRYDKIVQLGVTVRNSSSVASSGNVFTGTLNTTALIPLTYITGGAYYGAHAIMGSIGTTGAITIRNASSTSVTISGTNTVSVTWTYIVA